MLKVYSLKNMSFSLYSDCKLYSTLPAVFPETDFRSSSGK